MAIPATWCEFGYVGYPYWISTWISSLDIQHIQILGTYLWKLSVSRVFVWICSDMSRYPYISTWSKFPDVSNNTSSELQQQLQQLQLATTEATGAQQQGSSVVKLRQQLAAAAAAAAAAAEGAATVVACTAAAATTVHGGGGFLQDQHWYQ